MIENYYFILKDKKVVAAKSTEEWVRFFESTDKIIKRTTLESGAWVSTVFLGLPHQGGMFETMIFPEGNYFEMYLERCESYEGALTQHEGSFKMGKRKEFIK